MIEDAKEQRRREDARMLLQAHNISCKLWMWGSVLVPLLVLYLLGDWLDAKLSGVHGAWMLAIIIVVPVVSAVMVGKFIISGVLWRRYRKDLKDIYGNNDDA